MPQTVTSPVLDRSPDSDLGAHRPVSRAAPTEPSRHRPDIDGLRAVAILLVVAYHAHIPGLSAGFVGVDVFFVISGFLITRLIVDEIDQTNGFRLGTFWLRRARRLLPAATLVIACVLLLSPLMIAPLDLWQTISDGVGALTYRSNLLFTARATDYFGEGLHTSPFLHTWSLAVEEQFYLLWPVVFFLLVRFVPTTGRNHGKVRIIAVACLTLASFAFCLHLTRLAPSNAFFSTVARAWEFGGGALLALGVRHRPPLPGWLRGLLRVTGALLLMAALVFIKANTSFPGTAALLPVAATVALIAAEPSRDRLGRLLGARPVQALGVLSYAWYLWHWPVVVLGSGWLGNSSVAVLMALSIAALIPAELTRRVIETPLRRNPVLARSTVSSVAVIALITLVGAGSAVLAGWQADRALREPFLGALSRARADYVGYEGACSSTDAQVITSRCVYGDRSGSGVALVIGDSHAAHWIPAVDSAARGLDLRVTASLLGNCPSIDVRWNQQTPRCTGRQAKVTQLIDTVDPELVVVSHSIGYIGGLLDEDGMVVPIERRLKAWEDGMTEFAERLRARGTRLLVILDTPRFDEDEDPIDCMAQTRDPAVCDRSGTDIRTMLQPVHDAERAALAAAGHGFAYDPTPQLCNERCPVIVDGAVVYRDTHHLTGSFSRSLAPDIGGALRAALDAGSPKPDR